MLPSPPQTLENEIRQPQTLEEPHHHQQQQVERPQTLEEPHHQQQQDQIEQPAAEVKNEGEETAAEVNGEEKGKEDEDSKELDEQINEEEEKLEEQRVTQADATVSQIHPPNPRRRRRNPITEAQRAFAQQKLSLLQENFKPIPFSASKTLDFSAHEELFHALNLWDFVNLELSCEIRSDLLILLIANYDRSEHRSFVGNVEFSIGRLDLARALKLPLEEEEEAHQDIFLKDNSKEVINEFLSNYILLEDEDEDDMYILPEEMVAATQLVKEGLANKVDWAGLMWILVDKELSEVPRSGSYHYASHLQCLMKFQQPGLFEKDAEVDAVPVPEPEPSTEVSDSMVEEDEDDDVYGCGMKTRSLEDIGDAGCERQGSGLRLSMGGNGDLMDDTEDCEGNEEGDWVDDGKEDGFEHYLRKCSSNEVRGMEFENLGKGEEVEREDAFSNLERLTSTDLLHAMGPVRVSYSPRMNSLDQNSGEFVSMGLDGNMNASVGTGPGGSIFFENNGKRPIDNVDMDEDDFGQFHQNNQQKRMRCGGLWEEQAQSEFDLYMEQIQCTMGKAKMLFAEKEQLHLDAHLQLQYLNKMLEQKDQIIRTLEKTQVEEHQKWQQTVQQYKHELNIVASLVVCYKKALKETQNKFDEYRKKCPQGDGPLYRDVGGAGGLVLTLRELERLRLEKEEEMRRTAEEMINAFQCDWLVKFEDHREMVMMLHRRLVELEGEVKLMKESFAERKENLSSNAAKRA